MLTDKQKTMLRLARKAMDQFLPQTQDSAALAQEYAPIMRPWQAGTMEAPASYALNDLRTEDGVPYKCTQPHTHHGEPGWNPASGSSLWRRFHGVSKDTAWEFTADAANPYMAGEWCLENGVAYRCKQDHTVFAPSVLHDAWEEGGK